MVNHHNPSHGQKVDLGQNAPTKTEGAGTVPSESLAAESQREGGEFASNKGIHSENLSTEAASSGSSGNAASSGSSGHAASLGSTNNAASSKPTEYRDALLEDPSSVDDPSNGDASSRNNQQRSSETTTSSSSASRSEGQLTSLAGEAPTYVNSQYIKASDPHGKNLHEVTGEMKGGDGIQKAFKSEIGGKNDPSRQAEQEMQQHNNAMGREGGPRDGDLATETKFDSLDANKTA